MKCLVQPGEGMVPLLKGIKGAKKSIEILIFRFNRSEIEKALAAAVTRGVHVHALIASTNRGGVQNLRDLEMRLLAAGVTVSRTDDDLVRYHGKMMIVDRRVLYLLAFNFTWLDMERSRSFGIVTTNNKHVGEAVKLFEADTKRQPYSAGSATFIVSPVNARRQLTAFMRAAKKHLLIYDPEVSDPAIIRVLEARAKAGVDIRIIGRLKGKNGVLAPAKIPPMRLHTRSIVRDGSWAFVGSQSLRALELDSRREVGIIFRDPNVVARIGRTFEDDWNSKEQPAAQAAASEEQQQVSAAKVAKKVAKAVVEELPPVQPVIELTLRNCAGAAPDGTLDHAGMEETVKQAVKDAVRQAVHSFVEEVSESGGAEAKP
ncbi:MAG TPA: phospholipase D-like domain-containing protein [Bryobacteraceae bacterium]|nr:phospholipase D-like domain-containing protein [Bryobacteraceae bacterium]